MLTALSSYETCLKNSEKVYWDLAEAVDEISLDFDKRFLPEPLARVDQLSFLNASERKLLNQIGGHAYAHLFYFVEEFIIAEVHLMAQHHLFGDRTALRAMYRFCEEEVKHQKLFEAFKQRFAKEFPIRCQTIEGAAEVARNVTAGSSLSVMLLTSMLEWITQKHYLSCFKEGGRDIDASFTRLFHLHWLEEAQHAKLDSLEIDRIGRGLSENERRQGIEGFVGLCEAVDGLLLQQSELIVSDFAKASSRDLTESQLEEMLQNQHAALRWTFLGCGLEHPVFLRIIADLSPDQRDGVAKLAEVYC